MTNKEIRNRIKARRKEQQLSQADLAEKLSISQTAYYKIEKGNTGLISDHLPKIASILKIPEEELVLGYDTSKYSEELRKKEKRIAELESIIADKDRIIELQNLLLKKN